MNENEKNEQDVREVGVTSTDLLAGCSGLVYTDIGLKCKHGFPVFPQCSKNPMMRDGYGACAPCVDEGAMFRFFKDGRRPEPLFYNTEVEGRSDEN